MQLRHTLSALGLGLALTLPTAALAGEPLPDHEIAEAIDSELLHDRSVNAHEVVAISANGVVTLTGEVDNVLAKDRAQEIAAAVRGVKAVVNRIEVDAPVRDDHALQVDVTNALMFDPATSAWEIGAVAADGVVTLTGEVSSYAEKLLAARVAKGVTGVKQVQNELTLDVNDTRTPAEIRAEVEQRLMWNVYVDHALIKVEVGADGAVTLTGTVGSAAERQKARRLAWVLGVSDVDVSGLDVAAWARDDRFRENKYVSRSDEEIQAAIQSALIFDPRVISYEIEPQVADGRLTLRGTVSNLKARRAAEQDARSVLGVWTVKNLIKVKSEERPDDATLTQQIEDALRRDPYLSTVEVDVVVDGGVVTLTGAVDSFFERSQADDLASTFDGVLEVENELDVEDPSYIGFNPYVDYGWYPHAFTWYRSKPLPPLRSYQSDLQIEEQIRDEIFWSPFVDSGDVDVTVEDGMVTLSGTVDTWSEREAATENAFEGGAVGVDNDLIVIYGPYDGASQN